MSTLPLPLPDSLPAPVAPTAAAAGLQGVWRALRPLVGRTATIGGDAVPLERTVPRSEPAVLAASVPLEDAGAREVPPATEPLVAAFLDGIQRSRVIGHVAGSPLVFATVAAAVRHRLERRLHTWQPPEVRRLLLASRRALGDAWWAHLEDQGLAMVDLDEPPAARTDLDERGAGSSWHPQAARARALALVGLEREQLERQLAARWCAAESRWLWIDGGISGNVAFDAGTPVFGVVKSHTTLYGDDEAVARILALRAGERSPAFLVGHRVRRAVASWYLRWRAPANGDPLFGLVRVEVVPPPALVHDAGNATARQAFTRHCDLLTAAILLERRPVALPDPRWDTLAYGVHAVEAYLNACIGP